MAVFRSKDRTFRDIKRGDRVFFRSANGPIREETYEVTKVNPRTFYVRIGDDELRFNWFNGEQVGSNLLGTNRSHVYDEEQAKLEFARDEAIKADTPRSSAAKNLADRLRVLAKSTPLYSKEQIEKLDSLIDEFVAFSDSTPPLRGR